MVALYTNNNINYTLDTIMVVDVMCEDATLFSL